MSKEFVIDTRSQRMLELLAQGAGSKHIAKELGYQDGTMRGDPTETALLDMAARVRPGLRASFSGARRIAELPFDAARRRMTVDVDVDGRRRTLVKGAPETVIPRCTMIAGRDRDAPLLLRDADAAVEALRAEGSLRVLEKEPERDLHRLPQ